MNDFKVYDEQMTDNTKLDKAIQCKDCKWRDDGTVWSNEYTKTSCMMFPYPLFKPIKVIRNEGFCPYRKVGD